jgi:hypothetical protein
VTTEVTGVGAGVDLPVEVQVRCVGDRAAVGVGIVGGELELLAPAGSAAGGELGAEAAPRADPGLERFAEGDDLCG